MSKKELRKWINLFEADTAVKDKNKLDFDVKEPENFGDVSPSDNTTFSPTLNTASSDRAREKLATMQTDPETAQKASDYLSKLNMGDTSDIDDSDFEDFPSLPTYGEPDVETNTDNLPALVSHEVSTDTGTEPEWTQVKDLPGYFQQAIRMLGRSVFKYFTNEKLEDIQVLTSLINDKSELNAVGNWVVKNGQELEISTLDFSEVMDGYSADIQYWTSNGFDFLFVRDFAGNYIYAWDSKTRMIEIAD